MTKKNDEQEEQTFCSLLMAMNGGVVDSEMTLALRDLVGEVKRLGKNGSITLKINVKSAGDRAIALSDEITVKIPKEPRPGKIMFPDGDGRLFNSDPLNVVLPFKRVADEKTGLSDE